MHPPVCEEEMHEAWWASSSIMRLSTIDVFERSLKAPRPTKVLPRHYAS